MKVDPSVTAIPAHFAATGPEHAWQRAYLVEPGHARRRRLGPHGPD